MARVIILFAGCLAVLAGGAWSQEVVIPGFPAGVGGGVEPEFFQPYFPQLQIIADTLSANPSARAIVTGGADGTEYRQNHDAKNPGLALGRAHLLRNLMVSRFGVDSARMIVQSQESKTPGGAFRFASVRIILDPPDLTGRVEALENRPPVEKHFTETREVPSGFVENLGLRISAGLASSPFGALPTVAGAITWKRVVFLEGLFSHTAWEDSYRFLGAELDTRRRQVGILAAFYPKQDVPVGAIAGWTRIEEISQRYYDYVRMSEGPMFGVRGTPLDFLSVTVAWNPAKHRVAGSVVSQSKDSQFLVAIMLHKTFGGGK